MFLRFGVNCRLFLNLRIFGNIFKMRDFQRCALGWSQRLGWDIEGNRGFKIRWTCFRVSTLLGLTSGFHD
jgi:hypothetical protein